VNRNEAKRELRHCGYLHPADRLVFLWLLEHANNGDCEIPEKYAPTIAATATATGLHRRTVHHALAHLGAHGWVAREPHRGRKHRSSYRLMPRAPDPECRCEKVAPRHLLKPADDPEKVASAHGKGGVRYPEKVASGFTDPPESLAHKHLPPKGSPKEKVVKATKNETAHGETCAVPGCTRPRRHGLYTCNLIEHMHRELDYWATLGRPA
jgi:hypothetical protein